MEIIINEKMRKLIFKVVSGFSKAESESRTRFPHIQPGLRQPLAVTCPSGTLAGEWMGIPLSGKPRSQKGK